MLLHFFLGLDQIFFVGKLLYDIPFSRLADFELAKPKMTYFERMYNVLSKYVIFGFADSKPAKAKNKLLYNVSTQIFYAGQNQEKRKQH